jgi:hypothetical protein
MDNIFFNQAVKKWPRTTRAVYDQWRKERVSKLRWYVLHVPVFGIKYHGIYIICFDAFQAPSYNHVNNVQAPGES